MVRVVVSLVKDHATRSDVLMGKVTKLRATLGTNAHEAMGWEVTQNSSMAGQGGVAVGCCHQHDATAQHDAMPRTSGGRQEREQPRRAAMEAGRNSGRHQPGEDRAGASEHRATIEQRASWFPHPSVYKL